MVAAKAVRLRAVGTADAADFFRLDATIASVPAAIAQLVERQIVVLDVTGSNPVSRPNSSSRILPNSISEECFNVLPAVEHEANQHHSVLCDSMNARSKKRSFSILLARESFHAAPLDVVRQLNGFFVGCYFAAFTTCEGQFG